MRLVNIALFAFAMFFADCDQNLGKATPGKNGQPASMSGGNIGGGNKPGNKPGNNGGSHTYNANGGSYYANFSPNQGGKGGPTSSVGSTTYNANGGSYSENFSTNQVVRGSTSTYNANGGSVSMSFKPQSTTQGSSGNFSVDNARALNGPGATGNPTPLSSNPTKPIAIDTKNSQTGAITYNNGLDSTNSNAGGDIRKKKK